MIKDKVLKDIANVKIMCPRCGLEFYIEPNIKECEIECDDCHWFYSVEIKTINKVHVIQGYIRGE